MENADLLLTAPWILPIAPENRILEHHAVIVKQDRILDILPLEEAKQHYYAEQYLELKEHVLMPGLVNAHTHTPMTLFRGLADDLCLMDWLHHHIWPAEQALINETTVRIGAQLAIAEMLRSGITCFQDHYFFHDTIAAVAAEEGIRASVGCVVMNVPTQWAKSEKAYLQLAKRTLEAKPHLPHITWALAPQGPYTVSDASLNAIHELSQTYQVPIHMHVHETQAEIEKSLTEYGVRPLARLHQLGVLSERFMAVHMTQLTDAEIKLVHETNMHVVHCPESNLKLASGFAPISRLLKAGVNVALGTDGAASNNDLDLWGEMRTASLLAKAVSNDPLSLSADQTLAMATWHGAKALGLSHEIGSLEAKKAADIIAIDLRSHLTQPVYNPMSQLVYAMNRLQVSHVWVGGKLLLKNGAFTHLDIDAVMAQALPWYKKALPFKAIPRPMMTV